MPLTPLPPEMLSAYLDGELTPAEREAVEQAAAADPKLHQSAEALQTVSWAVRRTVEVEAEGADFKGLADRILAQLPSDPSLLERLQSAWKRPWIPVGMGALAAAAAVALLIVRTQPIPVPVPAGVVVRSASADSQAQLEPVVMKTESGDAIIWLVEHPDASGAQHPPALMQPDKPHNQVPKQERPKAGEL
jgi:anti-sigma factor RsiW